MAKQSGVGVERLLVDGIDVSGNISAVQQIKAARALSDITDLTQAAMARVGLLQSGELAFNSWWDGTPSTGVLHVFKGLRNAAVFSFHHGTALGDPAAVITADQASFDIARPALGSLAATVNASSTGGLPLMWGVAPTTGGGAGQNFAAAGNGSDLDDLAGTPTSTAFGAYLVVQLLSLGSGTPTFKVQDAATLPTYADVSGLTTGAMSVVGASRSATSITATIRRYLRLVATGTFTNAVVAAVIVRPISAQA